MPFCLVPIGLLYYEEKSRKGLFMMEDFDCRMEKAIQDSVLTFYPKARVIVLCESDIFLKAGVVYDQNYSSRGAIALQRSAVFGLLRKLLRELEVSACGWDMDDEHCFFLIYKEWSIYEKLVASDSVQSFSA